MKFSKHYVKHIFCLEGDWTLDLRKKASIRSSLQFLSDNSNINFIHRTCSTREELAFRMEQFRRKRYEVYSICYLAFHGLQNGIKVGSDFVTLEDLAEMAENKLQDKIIHFGACKALGLNKKYVHQFLKKTKALCVSGYKDDIDFLPSTVFDMLYFEMCQEYRDIRCIDRDMKSYYGRLVKELKFSMHYL